MKRKVLLVLCICCVLLGAAAVSTLAQEAEALDTPTEYATIFSQAGEGGLISPLGTITVPKGASITYTIAPADGYRLMLLIVDGYTWNLQFQYTFENVQTDHTIQAFFEPVSQTTDFYKDVTTDDWFYDYVVTVTEDGLFYGVSDTHFGPETDMTRGMFVTVLGRTAEKFFQETISGRAEFSDVDNYGNAYYRDYVGWAAVNGIVNGYGDGTFRPDQPVTREQMASMIIRFLTYFNQNTSGIRDTQFTDSTSISAIHAEDVKKAASLGIINGRSDGRFDPLAYSNRAEVAAVITRMVH